ncbi:hypothetical protein ANO11243_042310 [Dothideomycetidae sp. 11243]|nr:hypothetical protein ANO11243_042310 [fungal sp. No.11243]
MPSLKVIVVGGGPVGLTAAHSLEKAGIDFVLLEQRPEVVIDAGSNLVLSPTGLRVLEELGLAADIEAVTTPLGRIDRIAHDGAHIGTVPWFEYMKTNTGAYPRVVSRHDLTMVLYETLSAQSKANIFCNKRLSDITSTADGVLVACADGSSFSGSIVIGADGAHSKVRSIMRTLGLASGCEVNAEKPFLTTYQALWLRVPNGQHLVPGTTSETHGVNAATQLFSGADNAVIGLYERLPEPTGERRRFTKADEAAIVARWSKLPVAAGSQLTLGQAYASRIEAGLVSLEEGVVDHWSWAGRVVLAGDAAHKFTPSTGAGCNNGMIDVVVLINGLHSAGPAPSRQQIERTFESYQAERFAVVTKACQASGQATASATWTTAVHKFVDKHVISKSLVTKVLAAGLGKDLPPRSLFDFMHNRATVAPTAC